METPPPTVTCERYTGDVATIADAALAVLWGQGPAAAQAHMAAHGTTGNGANPWKGAAEPPQLAARARATRCRPHRGEA